MSLLRHNRDFALVWLAGLTSWVGNFAMFVALPIAVYDRTASTLATAATVACWFVPPVTVGQVAGVIADRADRRRLLVVVNLLLAIGTSVYLALERGPWWMYSVVAFVLSVLGQFLGPAEHALLPELVDEGHLPAAASLNALNNNIARLIGPALGGVLMTEGGFSTVAMADAVTYAIAAALMTAVRCRPHRQSRRVTASATSVVRDWQVGAQTVRESAVLLPLFVLTGVAMIGEGALSALLAPFMTDLLGGAAGAIGLMFSAQAVGGVVGSAIGSRMSWHVNPLIVLGGASAAISVLLFATFAYPFIYPRAWPAVALSFVAGVPFALWGVAHGYALQAFSRSDRRGRVFSLSLGVSGLGQLIGITLAGAAGVVLGSCAIFLDVFAYLIGALIALRAGKRMGRVQRQA